MFINDMLCLETGQITVNDHHIYYCVDEQELPQNWDMECAQHIRVERDLGHHSREKGAIG